MGHIHLEFSLVHAENDKISAILFLVCVEPYTTWCLVLNVTFNNISAISCIQLGNEGPGSSVSQVKFTEQLIKPITKKVQSVIHQ